MVKFCKGVMPFCPTAGWNADASAARLALISGSISKCRRKV